MADEKQRNEINEQELENAAGGKPHRVIVPDLEKTRLRDSAGDLTERGDCGGGVDPGPIRVGDNLDSGNSK